MECHQCGTLLPIGRNTCPFCGVPVSRVDLSEDGELNELLTEAHFLHQSGQHDEAISACMRILRSDADNPDVHTLLGEIYREKGDLKEAMMWFKQAAKLDPENQDGHRKLDQVIDQVFTGSTGDQKPLPPASSAPEHPLPRLQQWLMRLQPVHVVIGCTVLVVVVVLGIALHAGGGAPRRQTAPDTLNTNTPDYTASSASATTMVPAANGTTQVVPPPPDPEESGTETERAMPGVYDKLNKNTTPPATGGTTAEVSPLQPPTSVTPAPTAMTPDEMDKQVAALKGVLTNALRKSEMPTATLDRATLDPRTRTLQLDYTVPPMAKAAETKQALLYAGFRLIWAANSKDMGVHAFILRGHAYPLASRTAELAMIADVSSEQAEGAKGAKAYRDVLTYLSNPWWRTDLANAQL